jgi:2-methylisocitrate lyase-like PEP mutase family enzyme
MTSDSPEAKAERFLAAHSASEPLILPNAWDVASAKIFEHAGFRAIGTTSAGISAVLGYADGERMSLADNVGMVRRIARHTDLPVSADLERGYARSAEGAAESARAMLTAGVVGINIEDGTGDAAAPLLDCRAMAARIRAIRSMADGEGLHLVINARTDEYLVDTAGGTGCLARTIERGNAYRAAGADCVFVPDTGQLDEDCIAELVRHMDTPLNVIAGGHLPPLGALRDLGVARVSLGPRPMRALLALLRRISRELLDEGTCRLMTADALDYAEVNGWFR